MIFFSPEVTRDMIDILVVIKFPDFDCVSALKKKLLCYFICPGKISEIFGQRGNMRDLIFFFAVIFGI